VRSSRLSRPTARVPFPQPDTMLFELSSSSMGVRAGVIGVILVSSVFVAACSSHLASSGDAGGGDVADGVAEGAPAIDADPMTARGFCLGYLEVFAEFIARCDGVALEDAQRVFVGEAPCDRFAGNIAAGRLSFDGTHGATCLTAFRSLLTTCGGSSSMQQTAGCENVLTPLVPVGGTCTSFYIVGIGEQCPSGAYCMEGAAYACTGVCTARAPLGASCDPGSADIRCAQTATCDLASKKCVTPPPSPAEGEPCGGARQGSCPRALYCETTAADGGASTGLCRAKKTSGPCATDGECTDAERCVGTTARVCAPPKTLGDACTPGARECGLFDRCGSDGICTNTRAAVGEACGVIGNESTLCVDAAYCDAPIFGSGTCRASKHAGDACTDTPLTQCDGDNGHCDATTQLCVACVP
jgi:hypothetical protein